MIVVQPAVILVIDRHTRKQKFPRDAVHVITCP